MDRVVGALKATYNFFSGDAILLSAVIVAFLLGLLLIQTLHAPSLLVGVIFLVIIVGALVMTLRREIAGRPRQR
ncbi:MAG TPA: hypothetical protein VF792_04475 [Ktedonobacterales bacterium]